MDYSIEFKPGAVKDIRSIDRQQVRRILIKVELMSHDLQGDIKRLTDFTPEYRLRVGDYRVLFEIDDESIVIYRVRHRRDAYR
ncbi:MAG: type II toxin-antitoxin system RelE/ParE family toxin [Chloroflexi bacterium]|nr:type II toxin-antitoxin system RelE/ParE family toxin [Chloroflexota bacterium]